MIHQLELNGFHTMTHFSHKLARNYAAASDEVIKLLVKFARLGLINVTLCSLEGQPGTEGTKVLLRRCQPTNHALNFNQLDFSYTIDIMPLT